MIVPSIDISGGSTVQLVEGERLAIDAGDPRELMERLSVLGEVAVIDIDAARGEGSNTEVIRELCRMGPVRVGGGIRDVESALDWLDLGAEKVILGTAARPEILDRLPVDRVIVALDSRDDRLLTHGWRRVATSDPLTAIREMRGRCGGFLVTFVEREGRMAGTDLARARRLIEAAGPTRVTVAGGISSLFEIRSLDEMGADAQVGMALYTGLVSPGDAVGALLSSDRADGLWPTVVVDECGTALGLTYSDQESLNRAIDERVGVYHSRSRGLWHKGETSGATQELVRVDVDCDRDTLRFTVRQELGFCHTGDRSCWGQDGGLPRLARRIASISEDPTAGNTSRLIGDPELLTEKLREEAGELAEAETRQDVVAETADLLYFAMVKAASAGVGLEEIFTELDRREKRVRRRPMTGKEQP